MQRERSRIWSINPMSSHHSPPFLSLHPARDRWGRGTGRRKRVSTSTSAWYAWTASKEEWRQEHASCIAEWLLRSDHRCPMCRENMILHARPLRRRRSWVCWGGWDPFESIWWRPTVHEKNPDSHFTSPHRFWFWRPSMGPTEGYFFIRTSTDHVQEGSILIFHIYYRRIHLRWFDYVRVTWDLQAQEIKIYSFIFLLVHVQ